MNQYPPPFIAKRSWKRQFPPQEEAQPQPQPQPQPANIDEALKQKEAPVVEEVAATPTAPVEAQEPKTPKSAKAAKATKKDKDQE